MLTSDLECYFRTFLKLHSLTCKCLDLTTSLLVYSYSFRISRLLLSFKVKKSRPMSWPQKNSKCRFVLSLQLRELKSIVNAETKSIRSMQYGLGKIKDYSVAWQFAVNNSFILSDRRANTFES